MDAAAQSAAEQECHRALVGFFGSIDRRDYARALSFVTDDVVWKTRKSDLRGADQVRRQLEARSPDRLVIHLLSGIDIEIGDADHAVAHSYIVVYSHDRSGGAPPPYPLTRPLTVGTYTDHLVRQDGRWRISSKILEVLFQAQ